MTRAIRPMTPDDVPAVTEIDRLSNPLAWSEPLIADELARQTSRYLVLVSAGGSVEGFVGIWLVVGEAHITMIAVRPELRRHGFGEALLVAAIRLARDEHQEVVTLEVRRSNKAAIGLYRKYGFVEVGVRRAYYDDNREDALIYTSPPLTSATYWARFERLAATQQRG
jgi:ribosomal-protein-alanine N-acetyltransferase